MNKKLLLQDLTDQLAEAGRIKKKDAEEFLRAYFRIAEEALFEDGLIKIAGLGTLKLVKVEARKSVNVTTGEEFEIKEHYKISFLPDASLKESVNRPYSHLEPVELDAPAPSQSSESEKEKTTEENEKKDQQHPSSVKVNPVSESKQASASDVLDSDTAKTVSEAEDLAYGIATEKAVTNKQAETPEEQLPRLKRSGRIWWFAALFVVAVLIGWSWISNSQKAKENQQKISEMELIDSLENASAVQEELALNDTGSVSMNKDSVATEQAVVTDKNSNLVKAASQAADKPAGKNVTTNLQTTNQKETKQPVKQQKTETKAPAERTVPLTTAPPDPKKVAQARIKAAETKTSAPPVRVKAPATQQTSEAKKGLKATQPVKTNPSIPSTKSELPAKQNVKKTSSSGTLTYVTMEPGNRLTLLALKYYGHKAFWVYIYQENKSIISNPDNVPAGTRIRIPKADPALINANDPALVSKAQALQSQILNR